MNLGIHAGSTWWKVPPTCLWGDVGELFSLLRWVFCQHWPGITASKLNLPVCHIILKHRCFLPPTLSLSFLLLFNFGCCVSQAKQLPVWGRDAPPFMVYGLLNVSLLNPFISLDYSPQANFPSFHHENGLPAKKALIPAQVHLAFPDCQLLHFQPLKGLSDWIFAQPFLKAKHKIFVLWSH